MYKLFISHSHDDSDLAERLVELFRMGMNFKKEEILCSSIKGSIPTGINFIEYIKESVTECSAVIFLLTESYIQKPFCMAELGAAWAMNQTIFPLLVPPATVNDVGQTPLLGSQCLNLLSNDDLEVLGTEFLNKNISRFSIRDFNKQKERFLNMEKSQRENILANYVKNEELERYISDLTVRSQTQDEARFLLGTIYWEGILVKQDNEKAKELLTQAAQNNYAPAQYKLSNMYYKGDAGQQSFEKAFEWEKRAAEEGNDPWAMEALGFLYQVGLGCQKNLHKALEYYMRAVDSGYKRPSSDIGILYTILGDYKNAKKWFSFAVEAGDPSAALNLGLLYEEGYDDMPPDYIQASFYLHIAAKAGITKAKYQLGYLNYLGHGVFHRDFGEAHKWFTEAAEEGDIESQYNLAYLYQHSLGVEYNWEKAVYWYEKAAQRGHRLSQINLADLLAQSEHQQYEKALYWYNKAAEQNSGEAHRKLGDMYSFGIGCESNQILAIKHYQIAAKQGEKISAYRLKQSI